jgi:imidazolonepropionase-like amidohydrolase
MPGLIDGHQHLTLDKMLYGPRAIGQMADPRDTGEHRLVRACHNAQLALAAGVTTVRDCGAVDFSVLALRDAVASGSFVGPRILACGVPITTTAGHFYSGWGVDTVEEARKAVRQLAARGVDFVKVMLSGGTTSPGTRISRSQYTQAELRALVDDAHRLGLPVAAHAISTDSIQLAAQAGVDTIEHCSWIGDDPCTTVTDESAVQAMRANGVSVDHAIIPRPYLFPNERSVAISPEEAWWLAMLHVRWPFLHIMREQGVAVFLGTDAAFGPWPETDDWPGFQELARAIEIMVSWAGFSPLDALALATREAAKGLHLDREIGTLEPGKRADLVLLAGDPLADICAVREVAMVFRDGNLVAEQGQIVLAGGHTLAGPPRGWELPTG